MNWHISSAVGLIFLLGNAWASSEPQAIIGGIGSNNAAYAAFVDPSTNMANPIVMNLPTGSGSKIKSVNLNSLGQVFITGVSTFPSTTPYAAFVDFNTNTAGPMTSNLPPAGSNHYLTNGAINNKGWGIITGEVAPSVYAAFVDINTNTAGSPILNLPSNSQISTGAINDSFTTLIAGGSPAYAAFVDFNTNTAGANISNLPASPNAALQGCAINSSNQCLIGGTNGTAAYAAFIDINTNAAGSPIANIPTAAGSLIGSNLNFGAIPGQGVAINNMGQVIIGGTNGTAAYAAFVNINTNTAGPPIANIPTAAGSIITSVAINDIGQAMIGGYNGTTAYAAFVDMETNTASNPISNLAGGVIYSISLLMTSSPSSTAQIPTVGLTFNNKRFALYINHYAPQDVFYFTPAISEGILDQALETAAPTRNAIALFTADNNICFLNRALSVHLRNFRHFLHQTFTPTVSSAGRSSTSIENYSRHYSLNLRHSEKAPLTETLLDDEKISCVRDIDQHPVTLWFEAIGFLASQKAQDQTVGFHPYVGGAILGGDKNFNSQWQAGGGAAYTYTHIHENHGEGHSDTHQECLFAYTAFAGDQFYFNTSLWGGLFQIDNVRNIEFSGWNFSTRSQPKGWQLSPHVELGYEAARDLGWLKQSAQYAEWLFGPFAMLDWVNAWQKSYKETGTGPFKAGQKSHYSSFLRSECGMRVYELTAFDSWRE